MNFRKVNNLIKKFNKKNIKKSIYYIKNNGLFNFFRFIKLKIKADLSLPDLNNPKKLIVPFISLQSQNIIDNALDLVISVIIPTKNAGDDFDFTLKMIRKQKGFKEIEIIVVDSGSTDDTLNYAQLFGAKIIEILPEEFSHSYARNLGADHAAGKYLFFTVQDAIIPTDSWLYELVQLFQSNDIVALSAAEFPREDSDLFYRVISWNHYNFLEVNDFDRILEKPSVENNFTLRKNGQLSDIACLIDREIFFKYKYRLDYAEDLDLGIRLIKDGYKLAFLGTKRIIHSHNRSPYYFLKRGYVDNLFLMEIFSDFPKLETKYEEAIPSILYLYNLVNQEINHKLFSKDISGDLNFQFLRNRIKKVLYTPLPKETRFLFNTQNNNDYLDKDLLSFLESMTHYADDKKYKIKHDITICNMFENFLEIAFSYLEKTHEVMQKDLFQEMKIYTIKAFAITSGAFLAHCYTNSDPVDKNNYLALHTKLKAGI